MCMHVHVFLGRSNENSQFQRFWHILSEASSTGEYERILQGSYELLVIFLFSILSSPRFAVLLISPTLCAFS